MKKIIAAIISVLLICSLCVSSSAVFVQDEVTASFISDGNTIYLTHPIKAEEVTNDHTTIKDENGNIIKNDAFIPNGAKIVYYDSLEYHVVLLGDVNCDGRITSADARLTLRISARLEKNLPANAHPAADTKLSGLIPTASDARKILRCAASLDDFSDFEKILDAKHKATAEADYSDDTILVILRPDYAGSDAANSPSFYDEELVKSVEYLENIEVYILKLNTPSKENVDKVIENLRENDAVISAERSYISYLY